MLPSVVNIIKWSLIPFRLLAPAGALALLALCSVQSAFPYSVLTHDRFAKRFSPLPHWKDALARFWKSVTPSLSPA